MFFKYQNSFFGRDKENREDQSRNILPSRKGIIGLEYHKDELGGVQKPMTYVLQDILKDQTSEDNYFSIFPSV